MSGRLNHELPPWAPRDSAYLITACAHYRVRNSFCHPELGAEMLETIRWRNDSGIWYCELAVLLPDHIHLILNVPDETLLAKAIRDWKSWLARRHGIRWQKNFFDHRLRNEVEVAEKAGYVWSNPVRAGLTVRAEDWPYTFLAAGFLPVRSRG
jgi:putative transposase